MLNVASQEYAKAVHMKAVTAPVVTAAFPGPAVHAKQARGEMARFCSERRVTEPSQLCEFTGSGGAWRYDADASDADTYVFRRGSGGGGGAAAAGKKGKRKEADAAEEDEAPATSASRRRKK